MQLVDLQYHCIVSLSKLHIQKGIYRCLIPDYDKEFAKF